MEAPSTRREDPAIPRNVLLWRSATPVPGLEEGKGAKTAMVAALATWAFGIIAFASATASDGGATRETWAAYLVIGPVLAFGWFIARSTGLIWGPLPVLIILWVTLLGAASPFYLATGPLIAVVLGTVFVAWMGTEVAPFHAMATIAGVFTAGIASNDPFVVDRGVLVILASAFVVVVVGKTRKDALTATNARDELLRQMTHEARHDDLTQLGNRLFLTDRIEQLRRQSPPVEVAFALVDINDFKSINDTFGHLAGDAVLRHVATILRTLASDDGSAIRLGGDEFALVGPSDGSDGWDFARRLEAEIESSLMCEGGSIDVNASVGAVVVPSGSLDLQEVLRASDEAMYARKAGRHRRRTAGDASSPGEERRTWRSTDLSA